MTFPREAVRNSALRVAMAIALIALVTFPWDLQDHPQWYKVAWLPFLSGIVRPHDLLTNAILYLPLGFTLYLGAARGRMSWVVAVALVIATTMEIAQVWSHSRFPSATDVLMNTLGAVIGARLARRRGASSVAVSIAPQG